MASLCFSSFKYDAVVEMGRKTSESVANLKNRLKYHLENWKAQVCYEGQRCQRVNTKEHNRNQICVDQL
jgi:hypothetical protein